MELVYHKAPARAPCGSSSRAFSFFMLSIKQFPRGISRIRNGKAVVTVLLRIIRRPQRHKVFVSIHEVRMPEHEEKSGCGFLLALGREVPNEKWLHGLAELFARLDPDWNGKGLVVELCIPSLALVR